MAETEESPTSFRSFQIGEVLSTVVTVVSKNFLPLYLLIFLCLLPVALLQLGAGHFIQHPSPANSAGQKPKWEDIAPMLRAGGVIVFVRMMLAYVAQGIGIVITARHLAGERIGMGTVVRTLRSRIGWILLTALAEGVLIGLGLMLCVFPGIVLSCMYYVAMAACVAERCGPMESLKRSARLTEGHKQQIFYLSLVVGLVVALSGAAINFLVPPNQGLLAGAVEALVAPLQAMLMAVASAVVYVQLRELGESVDVESIADAVASP